MTKIPQRPDVCLCEICLIFKKKGEGKVTGESFICGTCIDQAKTVFSKLGMTAGEKGVNGK
ncbi:unnamed protein product [marine sediment metagenome]|uniref:Uncharacterized protein n=1 Tax=marine sediment metagenome TaxID=412755 RepID=X1G4H7_9ZZZZ